MTFKAAFQFTSKLIITLANLLSKTSAEYPRGQLKQIGSVPTGAALEYQFDATKQTLRAAVPDTDTCKLDPLLIFTIKTKPKTANSPHFILKAILH